MKYRKRRYFTQADRNLMWDRWQKGESAVQRLLSARRNQLPHQRLVSPIADIQRVGKTMTDR